MEKTNKVMRIVLSVCTFVAIALVVIGVLALPITATVADGTVVESSNIYEMIKGFIDQVQILPSMGEAAMQAIPQLVMMILAIVFTIVFGIIAIVKGIILLVKAIKGMSGKGELNGLLKSTIGFGVIVLIAISLIIGVVYQGNGDAAKTLGAGTKMMLSGGVIALAVPAVYRIATKDERKLLNKILGLGSVTAAIIGMILGFAMTLSQGDFALGLFTVAGGFVSSMTGGAAPEASTMIGLILALMGMVIVIVSLGFAKAVITNGYLIDDENKKADIEKSSIVKSALWLGFMILGFVLIVVPFSKQGFGMGIGAILAMVFGSLALGCAIANKILFKKSEAPKAE